MPSHSKVVYWDAAIFIAWMKDEKRPDPLDMDGVYEAIAKIESGEWLLVSGEILSIDMIETSMDTAANEKFHGLFKRRRCQLLPHDPRVHELAREIREYYLLKGEKAPATTDAIHLAYAIHYNVDEFQTFDNGKRTGGGRSLLNLDGDVAGHPLRIRKPPVSQPRLFS